MKFIRWSAMLSVLWAGQLFAQAMQTIPVAPGDVAGLRAAIFSGNEFDGQTTIIVDTQNGEDFTFEFTDTAANSDNALPDVFGDIVITNSAGVVQYSFIAGNQLPDSAGLVRCLFEGRLSIRRAFVSGFNSSSFEATQGCMANIDSSTFAANSSVGNGGAISASGAGQVTIENTQFVENTAAKGGALSFEGSSKGLIDGVVFLNNTAEEGCAIYFDSNISNNRPQFMTTVSNSLFGWDIEACLTEHVVFEDGESIAVSNTFYSPSGNEEFIDGDGSRVSVGSSILDTEAFVSQAQHSKNPGGTKPPQPMESCSDSGASIVSSTGYNISSDDTCPLNNPTDLTNTDPMLANNSDSYPVPQPGSAAIDGGLNNVVVLPGQTLATLPCGYVDLSGTARPQDGNSDGVFECDIGAMEVPGTGMIVDGHSGAFFNALRDGEGTYVEILNSTTAIIYTFTYRPDGSGPAWFIGVAEIQGNSLIVRELLRPIGTSFGAGFNAADIEFTPAGSMNMVMPTCASASPGGSVAYTGEHGIDYEALLTRATRLSNITGCGSETPSPNAGLSGSYFDPARDGEGIIVEWLTNGTVLVVFFTYDENDNQLWLIGIGTPNGNTVTMDALYASTFTKWGTQYDPDEVNITTWGTFTLTWTECGAVVFEFISTVGGYGSDTRNYSRLSTLAGTTCPDFE